MGGLIHESGDAWELTGAVRLDDLDRWFVVVDLSSL